MKKSLVVIALIISFILGSFSPSIITNAAVSVSQLQKQIKVLQSEVKKLKSQNASKDQEIKTLKNAIPKPINSKIAYNGNIKSGNYQVGNVTVPGILEYKGIKYTPINYLSSILEVPVRFNSSEDTFIFGNSPTGNYLTDIMEPYYTSYGDFYQNEKMVLGGKTYFKGFSKQVYESDENRITFGLYGKYKSLSGIVGMDFEYYNEFVARYSILVDGNEVWTGDQSPGQLPLNFNVDITGAEKIEFVVYKLDGEGSIAEVNFVNPLIK